MGKTQVEEVNSRDEGFIRPRRRPGGRKQQEKWRNPQPLQGNVATKIKVGALMEEGDKG